MVAYKLFSERKDGSLGPLFINKRLRVPFKRWMKARCHPTKGFAVRPGWHCTTKPVAPHLSNKKRVWCKVSVRGARQIKWHGQEWILAKELMVLGRLKAKCPNDRRRLYRPH